MASGITRPARERPSRALPAAAIAILALTSPCGASSVTVPDDIATIQEAIVLQSADTVRVRSGVYHEHPIIRSAIVVIGLPEEVSGAPPLVDGLHLDYRWGQPADERPVVIEDMDFAGEATIAIDRVPVSIVLKRCAFRGGIADSSAREGFEERLSRCTILGTAHLRGRTVHMDSCEVIGSIELDCEGFTFSNGTFSGPGAVALRALSQMGGWVTNTTFRGFDTGIDARTEAGFGLSGCTLDSCVTAALVLHSDEGVFIADNRVSDCGRGLDIQANTPESVISGNIITDCGSGLTLDAGGNDCELTENHVERCGTGIIVAGGHDVIIRENTVRRCRGVGISMSAIRGAIEYNIVGRCDGGIAACCEPSVSHNTVYSNAGDGIWMLSGYDPGLITHNIVYRNAASGMVLWGDYITTYCNDLFGNGSDDPLPGDLRVDPLFCDVEADDVSLQAGSPLLDWAGCGPIGALGQGCDAPTGTQTPALWAEREADAIRLHWTESGSCMAIERAEHPIGPWIRVEGVVTVTGTDRILEDRGVKEEATYWYRLVGCGPGAIAMGSPIEVEGVSAAFVITRLEGSPGGGPIVVEFGVGREAEIALEVLDVQGRFVASLASGISRRGRHSAMWDGRSHGQAAAPGTYFLRYRFPGGQDVRRVVRLQ